MKYLSYPAAVVALLAAPLMMPISNSAHAKQLTGTVVAQRICHDGANRGATVGIKLSWYDQLFNSDHMNPVNGWTDRGARVNSFASFQPKAYYAATNCLDLAKYNWSRSGVDDYQKRKFFVWYEADQGRGPSLCKDFNIKWANNGKEVWVQNGGSTLWNITCVLKD